MSERIPKAENNIDSLERESNFKMSLPFELSQEEALQKIKTLLGEVKTEQAGKISDLQEHWDGNMGTFSFKTTVKKYGIKKTVDISGTLLVGSNEVKLFGNLPALATFFKGDIESKIRESAEKILAVETPKVKSHETPKVESPVEAEKEKPQEQAQEEKKPAEEIKEGVGEVAAQEEVKSGLEEAGVEKSEAEKISGRLSRFKILGRPALDFLGGMATGYAVRKTVKASVVAILGGSGGIVAAAGAGALAGGITEGVKMYYKERKVAKAQTFGVEDFKKRLGELKLKEDKKTDLASRFGKYVALMEESDREGLSGDRSEVYEELKKELKLGGVNWQKIRRGFYKGAVIGGLGGAVGGWAAEHFMSHDNVQAIAHLGKVGQEHITHAAAHATQVCQGEVLAHGLDNLSQPSTVFTAVIEHGQGTTHAARSIVHDFIQQSNVLCASNPDGAINLTREQLVYAEDLGRRFFEEHAPKVGEKFFMNGEQLHHIIEKAQALGGEQAKNIHNLLGTPEHHIAEKTWGAMFDSHLVNPANDYTSSVLENAHQEVRKIVPLVSEKAAHNLEIMERISKPSQEAAQGWLSEHWKLITGGVGVALGLGDAYLIFGRRKRASSKLKPASEVPARTEQDSTRSGERPSEKTKTIPPPENLPVADVAAEPVFGGAAEQGIPEPEQLDDTQPSARRVEGEKGGEIISTVGRWKSVLDNKTGMWYRVPNEPDKKVIKAKEVKAPEAKEAKEAKVAEKASFELPQGVPESLIKWDKKIFEKDSGKYVPVCAAVAEFVEQNSIRSNETNEVFLKRLFDRLIKDFNTDKKDVLALGKKFDWMKVRAFRSIFREYFIINMSREQLPPIDSEKKREQIWKITRAFLVGQDYDDKSEEEQVDLRDTAAELISKTDYLSDNDKDALIERLYAEKEVIETLEPESDEEGDEASKTNLNVTGGDVIKSEDRQEGREMIDYSTAQSLQELFGMMREEGFIRASHRTYASPEDIEELIQEISQGVFLNVTHRGKLWDTAIKLYEESKSSQNDSTISRPPSPEPVRASKVEEKKKSKMEEMVTKYCEGSIQEDDLVKFAKENNLEFGGGAVDQVKTLGSMDTHVSYYSKDTRYPILVLQKESGSQEFLLVLRHDRVKTTGEFAFNLPDSDSELVVTTKPSIARMEGDGLVLMERGTLSSALEVKVQNKEGEIESEDTRKIKNLRKEIQVIAESIEDKEILPMKKMIAEYCAGSISEEALVKFAKENNLEFGSGSLDVIKSNDLNETIVNYIKDSTGGALLILQEEPGSSEFLIILRRGRSREAGRMVFDVPNRIKDVPYITTKSAVAEMENGELVVKRVGILSPVGSI